MLQKDHLRLYYQEAADHLINHGKSTNRIMIMMAQLDKNLVKPSTKFVTMSMLSECKTMTNNLTNWIGITNLCDASPIPGKSSRQLYQNLCVDKATHGVTGIVPVEAAFKFQRFVEKTRQLAQNG